MIEVIRGVPEGDALHYTDFQQDRVLLSISRLVGAVRGISFFYSS